jgi:large subunit ribosomal protein L1
MANRGKKYSEARDRVDRSKRYELEEGVKTLLEAVYAKFDEGVDLAIRLGVDPKKADQMVRGTVVLPNGIGKKVRVLVFAKGQKEKEALGGADTLCRRLDGKDFVWRFDKAIPRYGGQLKLGKILVPGVDAQSYVGLTFYEGRKDHVVDKVEKAGIVHVPVGKVSFGFDRLFENMKALLEVILRIKPPTSKGVYLRSITLSTTMGPGVKIDPLSVRNVLK